MGELSLEQRRAIAMASARARIANLEANLPTLSDVRERIGLGREETTTAEAIAGHPATRFAIGAARTLLGGEQYLANMFFGDDTAKIVNDRATALDAAQERGAAAYQRGELKSGIPEVIGAPVDAVSEALRFAGVPVPGAPVGGSEWIKGADFDMASTAGAVLDPAMLGLSRAAPAFDSAGRRILQALGFGAAAGTASPVIGADTRDEYFNEKLKQQALGGLFGLGVYGAVEGGKFAYDVGRRLVAPATEGGRRGILRRYYEHLLGDDKDNIRDVVSAVNGGRAIIPGSEPTLAQAASSSPKSTGLAAFESKIGRSEGNSPAFSQRMSDQQTAREKVIEAIAGTKDQREALKAEARAFMEGDARRLPLENARIGNEKIPYLYRKIRNKDASKIQAIQEKGRFDTSAAEQESLANNFIPVPGLPRISSRYSPHLPIAEQAKSAASNTSEIISQRKNELGFLERELDSVYRHGYDELKIDKILSGIKSMRGRKEYEGREFTEKALDTFSTRLMEIANPDGSINPYKLYGLRKDLGDQIEKLVKDTSTSDRRMTGGLQKEIQSKIDDAIESAGGSGWKEYISKASEYFSRMNQQKAAALIERALKGGASANSLENRVERVLDKYGKDVTPESRTAIERVVSELKRNDETSRLAGMTSLNSAVEKGREGVPELPRILEREYTIGNWLLKLFGQDAERKITREAMKYHMNPSEFVKLMQQAPQGKVEEILMSMGADPAAVSAMSRAAVYGTVPSLAGQQESPK